MHVTDLCSGSGMCLHLETCMVHEHSSHNAGAVSALMLADL